MLQYKKTGVSEGIDIKNILSLFVFYNVVCTFESYVCKKCHDALMTAYELKKTLQYWT